MRIIRPRPLLLAATLVSWCGCTTATLPPHDDGGFGALPDLAPSCSSNNDGRIDRGELAFPTGVSVRYLVNPQGTTVTVDPAGTMGASGPEWDLTSSAGDVVALAIQPVQGAWFASSFPDATYATTTDLASGTLGVFRVTDTALQLLGFASPDPGRTLLVYDQPIVSLKFPVQLGDGWVSVGRILNGVLDGKPFASTDTYRIAVDARGTAHLPYLDFTNTLRVQVQLTQTLPGGLSVGRVQYLFFHECAGEVGRMQSVPGDVNPAFTTAAEFRRLAL